MHLKVVSEGGGHPLRGDGPTVDLANAYLAHLQSRGFAQGTVRGYAFDLLNFSRFRDEHDIAIDDEVPGDLFDWLDWQTKRKQKATGKVVPSADRRITSPATMNRRVAAVRGLFEYAVITGARDNNPVPPGRRSTGLRSPVEARSATSEDGELGPTGGWCVRIASCPTPWMLRMLLLS